MYGCDECVMSVDNEYDMLVIYNDIRIGVANIIVMQ